MQILIVGIGALGGTIAARAIRTGLPVRLAARNTDSADGEGGIPHLPDSVMEVDSDVE